MLNIKCKWIFPDEHTCILVFENGVRIKETYAIKINGVYKWFCSIDNQHVKRDSKEEIMTEVEKYYGIQK